jgi:hypothetical protein
MNLRRRLTYANVVSSLTVFLALAGGTAFGATHLAATQKPPKHKPTKHKPKHPKPKPQPAATGVGRDAVTSASVVDNSLTGVDLADGAGVTGADVADGSLGGEDFPPGSLGGAKLADGSVTEADLADGSIDTTRIAKGSVDASVLGPKSIDSAALADGAVSGADLAPDSVTGRNIKTSTLSGVPDATRLNGHPATDFLSTSQEQGLSGLERGDAVGDGTFKRSISCRAGDLLIGGGPVGLDPGTTLVESFPKNGTWTVRVNPHGNVDTFQVQVICVQQGELR